MLWRKAEPNGSKLQYIKPAVNGSRAPPDPRRTALGGLDGVNLAHDAAAPTAGSGRAQAAAGTCSSTVALTRYVRGHITWIGGLHLRASTATRRRQRRERGGACSPTERRNV